MKKTLKSFGIKSLAAFLSVLMILTALPISVFAADTSNRIPKSKVDDSDIFNQNTYKSEDVKQNSLEEDVTLRDRFTKHYVDPDGNRYAVIFPEQVHYSDNDSWIEIDNSLSFDESSKRYVSNNERFKTRFSQNSNDAQLVSIEDGDYTLSWSISFSSQNISTSSKSASVDTQNSNGARISDVAAQVSEIDEETIRKVKNKDSISKMGKAASGIRYNGVFNNSVDLRYSILHGKVEEDVILNSSEGFASYTLTVNTNGLLAVKGTDNSIAFVTTGGETIFSLGAPWMKDSYVSVSNDIEVSLLQKGNVAYITYTPSSEWLNDESRVYPVLIDPSFTTRFYTSNYEDTYVYTGDSASTTRPTETTMKVGNISGNQYYAYVKILNIPELVGGWAVDEATLNFWVNTASSPALSLYEVKGEWSPTTITYSTQPSTSLIKSGATGTVSGSNSKYSIDLTSWFDNIYYYYYDISEYFNSSNWNGFKIGYTTNTTGNYTQIYSSEYSTTSYRPTMTIKYTYWPYGGIEDGAVYSFVNSASNKYLTVDGGSTTNGTNVYQYTKNNSLSQAFRLDYDETYNCFRIRAMCSSDGYGSVLEVPSYSGTINNTNGYTNSNVRIYSCLTAPRDDQEWLIYPHEYGDLYKIVLRADPSLALTSYGASNGTSDGNTSTSAGNVYVSEFTGAANQLWKLESGGIQVINATNIKEVYAEGDTYDMYENRNWISFCCPTTQFGDTVTWTSSNPTSVIVDNLGNITSKTAGQSTITAKVTHADGTYTSYSCIIYVIFEDGTYYFNNVSNDYRIEFVGMSSYGENEPLTVWDGGTAEPTQRFRLFKIRYLGDGLYSIRSMLDSSMGWTRSGTSLISTTIGTSDDTVPSTAKWRIKSNANGYYIHSYYGTSRTITCPNDPDADWNIVLQSYSSTNTLQNWTIKRITTTYHGVDIRENTSLLLVGSTFTFTASMYSTYTGEYGQDGIDWSVSGVSGSATINSSGTLTGVSSGTVIVTATYRPNSYQEWSDSHVVTIYAPTDIKSLRMTRDVSDEFTLCVATLYNGEKYWYQIDDYGNYSDVLLLSADNKNWLNNSYNDYVENGGSPYSIEYCVYQAKIKLNNAIANNQIYDVSQSSDEYFGLWLYFSLLEANYREAILLVVQGVNTMMTFVSLANQAYVLANNIHVLANTLSVHNSAQFMSGSYAVSTYNTMTNVQAVSQGITDITTYTGARPTWIQSEIYAASTRFNLSLGYKYNQSFKMIDGQLTEVSWGTSGSIRPDFYNQLTGHCVDIKNYTITTSSGRNSLVNNVVNQYNQRISILPDNTNYEVVIDVRGQEWTQDMLDDIVTRITQRTNGEVTVSFMK